MNVPYLLQSMRVVADGEGGSVQQWTTFAALWGTLDVHGESGAPANFHDPTHVVFTRCRSDFEITTAHRLVFNARLFQIRSVNFADERKRKLKLFVTEITALN